MNNKVGATLIAAAAAAALIGCGEQPKPAAKSDAKAAAEAAKASPAVQEIKIGHVGPLTGQLEHNGGSAEPHAKYMRDCIVPAMAALRDVGDQLEVVIPHEIYPLPTYREMLFVK